RRQGFPWATQFSQRDAQMVMSVRKIGETTDRFLVMRNSDRKVSGDPKIVCEIQPNRRVRAVTGKRTMEQFEALAQIIPDQNNKSQEAPSFAVIWLACHDGARDLLRALKIPRRKMPSGEGKRLRGGDHSESP